jgi:tyrosyl-tRNA synthetase
MGLDSLEHKLRLIELYPTKEILTKKDLIKLLESGEAIRHYIGFEISGFIHIGTGLFCASKIADLQRAGIKVTIFLADWHSWINKKLGENWEAYRVVGKYFDKTLRKLVAIFGGDEDTVDTIFGSELYHCNDDYWRLVIEVSKHTTLARVRRSITILGRKQGEAVSFGQLIYVPMQVADIFQIGVHIAHAGIDQRKAHVIAREVAPKITVKPLKLGDEIVKPVALHHELLLSLGLSKVPESKEELIDVKMSKSKPETAIFVHEDPESIKQKILKGFCPPREVEFNPIIQLAKLVYREREEIVIPREQRYGGDLVLNGIQELLQVYKEGKLHPLDLKRAVAEEVANLLKPLSNWFESGEGKHLLEEAKQYLKITR